MGTGLAITLAYSVFEASLCGGFAFFATGKLAQYGYHISWVWPAVFMVRPDLGAVVLRHPHLGPGPRSRARHRGADPARLRRLGVLLERQPRHRHRRSTRSRRSTDLPASGHGSTAVLAGTAGVGVFFAFWSWVGFEMAPNYGEESKNPKKIVPMAMYISVIGLGIFYTVTSWASISAYTNEGAAALAAQNNYYGYYLIPAKQFGNQFISDLMSYLILTGSFACGMAFHKTTARYMYSLGRERVLPQALGRTHPKYHSPHVASITQTVIAPSDRARVRFRRGHRRRRHQRLHLPVRPHGRHGRRRHPVRPGARLGRHHQLLPHTPRGRARTGGRPRSPR